jgi:hypothetical protein
VPPQWFNQQIAARPENVTEIVMDVMYRIAKNYTTDIRKRAIKAAHFLTNGVKLSMTRDTTHDLMFLGELLPEETSSHLNASREWVTTAERDPKSHNRDVNNKRPMTLSQIIARYPP